MEGLQDTLWGAGHLLCDSHPPLAGERLNKVGSGHVDMHNSPGVDLQPPC